MVKPAFLIVFLCLLSCALISPAACADVSELRQVGWAFIKDVLMLDVTKYNVSVWTLEAPVKFGAASGWIDVTYKLSGAESDVTVGLLFKDGRLAICSIYFERGLPLVIGGAPLSPLEWARILLERHWRASGKDYVKQMLDMLSNIEMEDLGKVRACEFYPSYSAAYESRKELTGIIKTVGNVKMSIVIEPNDYYPELNTTYIKWEYVENGVVFRQKEVSFTFSPTNMHFVDQWDIYRVGSSMLKVSTDEEALRVAREAVRDLTYVSDGKPVGNLTVLEKPLYVYLGTDYRGSDIYTLYPYWEVYLCLNKVYPAGVTGIRVFIWADTGEVFKRELSGGYGGGRPSPPTQEANPQANQQAIIISIATVILTTTAILTIRRKLKTKPQLRQ
ncbi:MAG: hypothetical protein N3F10_05615 [Candidatus Bathyarchaeota archaeon]|nr:hypothetical protein [Candidatus Bathyarchaeota archaeon]